MFIKLVLIIVMAVFYILAGMSINEEENATALGLLALGVACGFAFWLSF